MVDFDKLKITKEELFIKMREHNIGLQLHYIPIIKQPYYKSWIWRKGNHYFPKLLGTSDFINGRWFFHLAQF